MELNFTFFTNESSGRVANSSELDIETTVHPLVTYLIVSIVTLLVVIPALTIIIIVLKNRKLRDNNSNVLYVNLLITDMMAALIRWIVTSLIMICYLLDVPNVNCNIVRVPIITSTLGTRLMLLLVIINRFLHIALPFSYKSTVTTKRVSWSISSLWLMALACGIFSAVSQSFTLIPTQGICAPRHRSIPLFLINLGSQVVSVCIITGTCIYLRYKIIHSNRFFKSVKRNATEERKAVKVGRLVEILQEQVRPTFSVFLAGGLDAAFNGVGIVYFLLVRIFDLEISTRYFTVLLLQFGQLFSHAVVYVVRDNDIRKELLAIYKSISGPNKSKVIVLNGQ